CGAARSRSGLTIDLRSFRREIRGLHLIRRRPSALAQRLHCFLPDIRSHQEASTMGISVTFWGVRGSIATPGPDTIGFGGNTSCVEVVCGERRVVLDPGTGMRLLGQRLVRERQRVQLAVFYSHMHWDHIQGLPFFTPLYIPGSELAFHGMPGLQSA